MATAHYEADSKPDLREMLDDMYGFLTGQLQTLVGHADAGNAVVLGYSIER